jgi:cytochrome o ubiquinol oxidase operon protein cyoD
MTTPTESHALADDHGADGDHGHDDGAPHATLKDYLSGFLASVILTALAFWLVMGKVYAPGATLALILALGSVQIVVHVIYFLHMNTKSQAGWNILALMFTLTLVVITLAGSLWVMYHLNQNMMPVSPQQMRNMP